MEAFVQMTGYVGGEVSYRNNSMPVADFRLASTPRMQRGNEWANGETTWITVKAFRSLAEHLASSLHRGDPVLVIGELRTTVWTRDGVTYERLDAGRHHGRTRPAPWYVVVSARIRPNVGDEGADDAGPSAGGDALDPQALNPGIRTTPGRAAVGRPTAGPTGDRGTVSGRRLPEPRVVSEAPDSPSGFRLPGAAVRLSVSGRSEAVPHSFGGRRIAGSSPFRSWGAPLRRS